MGILFLVFCGGALLLRGAVLLRITQLFRPHALRGMVSDQQRVIGRKLISLAQTYAGLRTGFERFRGSLPPVFLVISNHQSLADIAALSAAFPRHGLRFVAKKELARGVPYVSIVLRLGRHAIISRTGDYRRGYRELVKLADLAGPGLCPVVFPEGRRSRTGNVQPFLAGAVRIILERAPLPVLSVAVDGGYRISTIRTLLTNVNRTQYRLKPLTLYPAPKGKAEILALLARTEREISEQVRIWRESEHRDALGGSRLQGRRREPAAARP